MLNVLRQLVKPKYETLNRIEIKAECLLANYKYLCSLQPLAAIFPVLKSNAYGHGLKEVCQILNNAAVPMVAVDSYPEAQIVYRYFKGQVLILGEMPLKVYDYCLFQRTEFVVYNPATLKYLTRFGRKAKIHLFVNSGMNREGLQNFSDFLLKYKKYLDQVTVNGFCSHLASADTDSALNKEQEEKFFEALAHLRSAGFSPRWVHLGNSAAIFTLASKELTAFRPGLAFYGYDPFCGQEGREDFFESAKALQPALEVYSRLVAVQDIVAGESVSYNETYRAAGATKIGVIPFGYFEGLDRRLSGRARFLVHSDEASFWAPVAGRICMNLSCLDCGQQAVTPGEEVQLVSSISINPNSMANLATLSGMSIYELLTRFQANIKRKIL